MVVDEFCNLMQLYYHWKISILGTTSTQHQIHCKLNAAMKEIPRYKTTIHSIHTNLYTTYLAHDGLVNKMNEINECLPFQNKKKTAAKSYDNFRTVLFYNIQ